jgi:hypothetical protein
MMMQPMEITPPFRDMFGEQHSLLPTLVLVLTTASFSQQIGEALQVAPLLPEPDAMGEQSMPISESGWRVEFTPVSFAICWPKLEPACAPPSQLNSMSTS